MNEKAMALEIHTGDIEQIKQHGVRAYPKECCGALLGVVADDGGKVVRGLLSLDNRREGEAARRRFLVTADDYRFAENTAREKGWDILGFYHSHPDHPARPSDYDREHALPWCSYIIVSVEQREPKELTNWILAEDRSEFLAEPIHTPVSSTIGSKDS